MGGMIERKIVRLYIKNVVEILHGYRVIIRGERRCTCLDRGGF